MGFFSFQTCDTNKSIMNINSDKFTGKVYLLLPGEQNIVEDAYEGYGVFGGVDAYELLAERNIGVKNRELGIKLSVGTYYYSDSFVYLHKSLEPLIPLLSADFTSGREIKLCDKSYTDEMESLDRLGKLYVMPIKQVFKPLSFHLKFSFCKHARYENYPPSKDCPVQGYFG